MKSDAAQWAPCVGGATVRRPRWPKIAASLLLASAVLAGAGQDRFIIHAEQSPREAAIGRLMDEFANTSSPPWLGRRVVSAMTTTPMRINLIEPALDSLLKQRHVLDEVYLFVPHVFLRDGSRYTIPEWLTAKKGITLRRCEDSGPATHMLEVLKAERDPETYILQVDDDQVYGPDLLQNLLRATGPFPGRAVAAATQHAHSHLGGIVTEGVHGVLFPRKAFDVSIFNFDGFAPTCRLHDDLWISAHLAKRAVRREGLGGRFGTVATNYGYGADALYMGGAGSDNTKNFYLCMASLLRADPRLWEPKDRVVLVAPLLPDFGRDKHAATKAVQHFTQELRRLGVGPYAVYLSGPVPAAFKRQAAESFVLPDGAVQRLGGWLDGVDLIIHDAGPTGRSADALSVALRLEEDPEAIFILLERPPYKLRLPFIEQHVRCLRQLKTGKLSREICRGSEGSTSFRRSAAYEVGRVHEDILLPYFGMDFHTPEYSDRSLGSAWRELSDRWRPVVGLGQAFADFIAKDQPENIATAWKVLTFFKHRIVASLSTTAQRLRYGRMTISSLLRQRPMFARIYVFVLNARRGARGCAPAWLASRHRVSVVCDAQDGALAPLMGMLARERSPQTFVFFCDDAHAYGASALQALLRASDVYAGTVLATAGSIYGAYGGPVPSIGLGILCRRSFLDTRLAEDAGGPCAERPDMLLAAHVALKGVPITVLGGPVGPHTRALGDERGTRRVLPMPPGGRRLEDCRRKLVDRFMWLWTSKPLERTVVWASPFQDSDAFLLDLTLRYAAMQTRKPDEIVMVAFKDTLLDRDPVTAQRRDLGDAEIELRGYLGLAEPRVRTRAGEYVDIALDEFLAGRRDRAGCVVRVHPKQGLSRSFLFSVKSCGAGGCNGVGPMLTRAFESELEPSTAILFVSAERLVNERLLQDTLWCLNSCQPNCRPQQWCGQSTSREDGAVYDLAIRRAAGYKELYATR